MTEEEAQEWRERLRIAVAEVLRRRAAKAAIRKQLAETRALGLEARHRDKLNRKEEETT